MNIILIHLTQSSQGWDLKKKKNNSNNNNNNFRNNKFQNPSFKFGKISMLL